MADHAVLLKICQYLLDFEHITDKDLLKEKKKIANITHTLKITNNDVYDIFKELGNQKALVIPPLNTSMENITWTIDFEKLRAILNAA